MKTYEFVLQGSEGPARVVITHDDEGEPASIEPKDCDIAYEQAMSEMGFDSSEVAAFLDVLGIASPVTKERIVSGSISVKGMENAGVFRMALALAIPVESRQRALRHMTGGTRSIAMGTERFGDDNLVTAVLSLADKEHIFKIIVDATYMSFEVFLELYKTLDETLQWKVIDQIHMNRYTLQDFVALAMASDESNRLAWTLRIIKSAQSLRLLGGEQTHFQDVIRNALDLAETIANDWRRLDLIATVLIFHGNAGLKPKQSERITEMLLAIDPELFQDRGYRDTVLSRKGAFTDQQYARLYRHTTPGWSGKS